MKTSHRQVALVAALLVVAVPAHAGIIRGTLHVPSATPAPPSMNAYAGRANSMPGMKPSPRGLVSDAVISVDRVPASAESALAVASRSFKPKLAQKNQAFEPRVLPIAVGTVVDFPNMDAIYHNVFSLSPVRRFDLGKYPQGHSKTIAFTKIGLVNVYCDIHSSMEAFVLILPNHGFTQPRAAGEYALPELPPGHYTVTVWHPDLGKFTREADVPASGDVTLDLSY